MALQIPEDTIYRYFSDGRRISFLLERRLATEVFRGNVADSEKADYDIIDSQGHKYEVRCISRSGVYFTPSSMVGSGRKFNKLKFYKKLETIHAYVLCDIAKFPTVPCWSIASNEVLDLYNHGKLGKTCRLSRKSALRILNLL